MIYYIFFFCLLQVLDVIICEWQMSCLSQELRFFFAGKEPVYYNIDTLISEICAAKGVLPEQDAIILAGYLHEFRKML